MSEYEIVYSTLRTELASAYWQAEHARVVTLDVQIDPINIHWAEKPIVYWNDILIRAINEKKIRVLLERTCSGKPDMEVLKDRFLALYAGPDPAFTQEEDERLPFPLSRSYSDIVKGLRNGTVVPVLGPSVNPRIYIDLAARLVKLLVDEDFPDDPQVADEREKKKFVEAYYGSPCTICHFLPALVPPGCPLLAGVPKDVDSSVYDEQMLSVAKTNCRNLSQLYETRTEASLLYSNIAERIIESSKGDNAIHLVLARLLNDWEKIRPKGLKPDLPFQFIITTNFDAGLERVFDREGIPYDLVWLVAAGSNRGKWLHLGYRAQERVILEKPGTEASRKGPTFPFGKGFRANPDPEPRVIIIKIFGSINDADCRRVSSKMQDEDHYFLITQDQMESFFSDRVDNLADKLVTVIQIHEAPVSWIQPEQPRLACHRRSPVRQGNDAQAVLDHSSM